MMNVVSSSGLTRIAKINNNTITLANTGYRYGILCDNSAYSQIYCNNISCTTIPASGYRLTVRGIQVRQCANATVRDNTTTKVGVGIRGAGSLLGTQFKCNTSDGNYNGFYFDAAYNSVQTVTSAQGSLSYPNDDQWYNVPSGYYMIDAATGFLQSNKSWYYRNVAGYNPTLSSSALGGFSKVLSSNPLDSGCTSCGNNKSLLVLNSIASGATSSNTDEINDIINGSNNYNELDASFKYFEKQYAFSKLLSLSAITSSSQSDFLETLKNSNIGLFEKLYNQLQNGSYDSATILNQSIVPLNEIETQRKWVNQVYLDYVVSQTPIPQAVIGELETLASSSPFVEGDAVYTARAIVNYQEPEPSNPKSMEVYDDMSTPGILQVKVYPNPANDYLYIDAIGEIGNVIEFSIIDVIGVRQKVVNITDNQFKLDIHSLSQGIYWYQLKYADKIVGSGKFIISR